MQIPPRKKPTNGQKSYRKKDVSIADKKGQKLINENQEMKLINANMME